MKEPTWDIRENLFQCTARVPFPTNVFGNKLSVYIVYNRFEYCSNQTNFHWMLFHLCDKRIKVEHIQEGEMVNLSRLVKNNEDETDKKLNRFTEN